LPIPTTRTFAGSVIAAIHRHTGDQWTAVQEGEITFTVKGQLPVVLKAGDSNYVPRGIVHRQQNLSDKPARHVVVNIFDKGKVAP
jgi:quercetin dioxygenase-like cupin family protein